MPFQKIITFFLNLKIIIIFATLLLTSCSYTVSEIEINHYRDLAKEGQIEYISELIKGLKTKDEKTREHIISALSDVGEPASNELLKLVRSESKQSSGAALIALAKIGDPKHLEIVRAFQAHPYLSKDANRAEKEMEAQLYEKATKGELQSIDAYLEFFTDPTKVQEIKKLRRNRIAQKNLEQMASPSIAELEAFLKNYGDTEEADNGKRLLAQVLIKEAKRLLDTQEFAQSRALLERVPNLDARKTEDANHIRSQSYILQGKMLKLAGKDDLALHAFEQVSENSNQKLEVDKLKADVLMSIARKKFENSKFQDSIIASEKASRLDPVWRSEATSIKGQILAEFTSKSHFGDANERKNILVAMFSMGNDSSRYMELYLSNLFARKAFSELEEVITAFIEAKKNLSQDVADLFPVKLSDVFAVYLKNALNLAESELSKLFESTEFAQNWSLPIDPLDPKQTPLLYRVEEITGKYWGFTALNRSYQKNILNTTVTDDIKELSEAEIKDYIQSGQIGQEITLPRNIKTQIAVYYSKWVAEFSRRVIEKPDTYILYASGFNLIPSTPSDWLLISQGFLKIIERVEKGERVKAIDMKGGINSGRINVLGVDQDPHSLTVRVHDPNLENAQLTTTHKQDSILTAVSVLINTTKAVFMLYPSLEKYTVLMGGTETSLSGNQKVRGGQFEPTVRMSISNKVYKKWDFNKLKAIKGVYTTSEYNLIEQRWNKWGL